MDEKDIDCMEGGGRNPETLKHAKTDIVQKNSDKGGEVTRKSGILDSPNHFNWW